MKLQISILLPGDAQSLERVAEGVFDGAVRSDLAAEFAGDPRHHICIATEDDVVVGFASGVHYVHPDKPAELWINEVAVASPYQRQGIAQAVLAGLLEHGRSLGCTEAWVLTDADNAAARALYRAAGGKENSDIVYVTFPLDSRDDCRKPRK